MRAIFVAAMLLGTTACTTVNASAPTPAPATPQAYSAKEEEEILQVVDRMLLAVGNHDSAALQELLINEGVSWFQHITPEEAAAVEPFHNEDLMSPETDADPFIERYWNPTVQIRGSIAHVWAPYELRDDGKQVHCGIDAFDLVYLDGDWRVASILSTMEPKGCDAMMPDSLAAMRPRDGWKETPNQ